MAGIFQILYSKDHLVWLYSITCLLKCSSFFVPKRGRSFGSRFFFLTIVCQKQGIVLKGGLVKSWLGCFWTSVWNVSTYRRPFFFNAKVSKSLLQIIAAKYLKCGCLKFSFGGSSLLILMIHQMCNKFFQRKFFGLVQPPTSIWNVQWPQIRICFFY